MNAVTEKITINRKEQTVYYSVIQEELHHPDLGTYKTFGLLALTPPDHSYVLHDVSLCETTINRLVTQLNQNDLAPVHMKDVVYDMLT